MLMIFGRMSLELVLRRVAVDITGRKVEGGGVKLSVASTAFLLVPILPNAVVLIGAVVQTCLPLRLEVA